MSLFDFYSFKSFDCCFFVGGALLFCRELITLLLMIYSFFCDLYLNSDVFDELLFDLIQKYK